MPTSVPDPALQLTGVSAGYGRVPVVRDASLVVHSGEIVALLGPNGAGKTTLLRAVSGEAEVTAGDVVAVGRSVRSLPAHRRARLGFATVPEGRALVPELSVRSNLLLGTAPWNRRYRSARVSELADEMFERFPVLERRRHQAAGSMSGGEQQMLAIARALMARPSVLMLDEPSLGLAPRITRQVFMELVSVADTGTAVLVAEQNTTAALRVATRSYVMESGAVAPVGDQEDLADILEAAFLGQQRKGIT